MAKQISPTSDRSIFFRPRCACRRWRDLVDAAKAWSDGSGDRAKFEAALSELAVTEEFHAYPGPHLMTALREKAAANDARPTLTLADTHHAGADDAVIPPTCRRLGPQPG